MAETVYNYLTFEPTSCGTLFTNWSTASSFPGAIASFKAGKPVPKFKMSQNGGKNELIRDMQGPKVKNFYTGVCQFVKMAKENAGVLTVVDDSTPNPYRILCLSSQNIGVVSKGAPIDISKVEAVAATHKEGKGFDGVKTLATSAFLSSAEKASGAAIVI